MTARREPSMAKAWCGHCGRRLPDRDESVNRREDYLCVECGRRGQRKSRPPVADRGKRA